MCDEFVQFLQMILSPPVFLVRILLCVFPVSERVYCKSLASWGRLRGGGVGEDGARGKEGLGGREWGFEEGARQGKEGRGWGFGEVAGLD